MSREKRQQQQQQQQQEEEEEEEIIPDTGVGLNGCLVHLKATLRYIQIGKKKRKMKWAKQKKTNSEIVKQ